MLTFCFRLIQKHTLAEEKLDMSVTPTMPFQFGSEQERPLTAPCAVCLSSHVWEKFNAYV